MIENCREYTQPIYIAFIYYEKAFDSGESSAVIQALRSKGVNEHCLRILEKIYNGSTVTIVVHKESSKIPKKKRASICLMKFTACLQETFRTMYEEQVGLRKNGAYISNLRFPDHVVLLSNSWDVL